VTLLRETVPTGRWCGSSLGFYRGRHVNKAEVIYIGFLKEWKVRFLDEKESEGGVGRIAVRD
jgi:hypothetical protein